MSRIHIKRFQGIAPKVNETLLREEQAQVAKNTRLWSQALSPLHGYALGVELDKTGAIQTIYRYAADSVWLCWTQAVNAVRGPVKNDALEKLYFTGTDMPRVTTNALYSAGTPGTNLPPASWKLGIPAPVGPPVATDNGAGNITATAVWAYTFVRKYSDGWVEESAPSPASNELTLAAKQASVTVPSGAITVADYGITHKWLYRSESGGPFFFAAEVAVASASAVDNVATVGLGDAIETTRDLPPPDGMIGLIQLPNGLLAGHKDNVVYICEPGRPHAYPLLNQYTMNATVVGLGNVGNTIVVITEGKPEIGRGVDPAAWSFKRSAGSFPCVSARSISSSEVGVFWSTPRGMALSDGSSVSLATEEFISRKEWKERFYPDTIHGVVHDGRYYGWFETGVDVDGNKVGGGFILDRLDPAFLSEIGEYVYAAYAIPESDDMHVVRKNPNAMLANYTYQWDADPTAPLVYEWKSKVFITPGLENFGVAQIFANYADGLSAAQIADLAAQIAAAEAFNDALTTTDGALNGNADGYELNGGPLGGDNQTLLAPDPGYITGAVTFQYWADGELKLSREVTSNEPFPLPSGFLAEIHEFQVSGAVEVDQITIASSADELAGV